MHVQPYLFFEGRCEEAIEFYRGALGAEVIMMMRMKDNPEPSAEQPIPPGAEEKILHASFKIGDTVINGSDGMCQGAPTFQGISLSLTAKDAEEAKRAFDALADGGQVHMPLTKTFFSPTFGMLADRFGVAWMVLVQP